MVKDKREEQHAILDELETIKSLLNEDDLANIPILNQRLPDTDEPLTEIPLLTQVIDDLDETFSAFFTPRTALQQQDKSAIWTPASDTPTALAADQEPLTADQESDSHQQRNRQTPIDTNTLLAPGVLPGQQTLFDHDPEEKLANAFSSDGLYTTEHDSLTERPVADRSRQRHSNRLSPPVKARGENPFLPKHIRDRLHTNKTLVDIIRDYPPAPEIQPHPTNHVVEELIAEFMPKIETELRQRLLKLADEGKLESKS